MGEKFLKEAHIELVSYCNYKCSFCTNPFRTKEEGGILPWAMFTNLVEQCVEAGVTDMSLHGSGDPSLYKSKDEDGNVVRVADAIRYASERGLNVLINSNCHLFTKDDYRAMFEAGLQILRVSFHGWDKAAYEQYMRNDGYDKVLDDLSHIAEWNEEWGTNTELHSTHLSYDFQDLSIDEQIAEYRKNIIDPLGCQAEIWRLHDWAGQMDVSHEMYQIRKKDLASRRTCGRPFAESMEIRANGKVSICCFDMGSPYYLGDLNEQTIEEVYFGDKYEFARDVHRNEEWEKIDLCNNCDQLYHFSDALAWTNIPGRKYGQSKASKLMYIETEK